MKKAIIIFISGILIFSTTYIVVNIITGKKTVQNKDAADKAAAGQAASVSQPSNGYQPQTDSQASVDIEVTPKTLGVSEEKNIFAVVLDTHSVELDFDFAKIMTLKDDSGKAYQALKWTGESGSHHLSGDIIFPKLQQPTKKITILIDGVGGVNRQFIWELK